MISVISMPESPRGLQTWPLQPATPSTPFQTHLITDHKHLDSITQPHYLRALSSHIHFEVYTQCSHTGQYQAFIFCYVGILVLIPVLVFCSWFLPCLVYVVCFQLNIVSSSWFLPYALDLFASVNKSWAYLHLCPYLPPWHPSANVTVHRHTLISQFIRK